MNGRTAYQKFKDLKDTDEKLWHIFDGIQDVKNDLRQNYIKKKPVVYTGVGFGICLLLFGFDKIPVILKLLGFL